MNDVNICKLHILPTQINQKQNQKTNILFIYMIQNAYNRNVLILSFKLKLKNVKGKENVKIFHFQVSLSGVFIEKYLDVKENCYLKDVIVSTHSVKRNYFLSQIYLLDVFTYGMYH